MLSGRRASERTATGLSQHLFTGAATPLVIGAGDKLVAHVFLDPANPPEEIMLQFNDGTTWEHRAYWGATKIDWGADHSPSRLPLGPLPPAGRWVRLEVDAAAINLPPGTAVSGLACTQFGGHVFWDKLGLVTRTPQGDALYDDQETWELAERAAQNRRCRRRVQEAIKLESAKRTDEQRQAVRDYFVRHCLHQVPRRVRSA